MLLNSPGGSTLQAQGQDCCALHYLLVLSLSSLTMLSSSSSSCMRVMNHNWSARKQRPDKPPLRTQQCVTWVSLQGHRSVSASRHFLLQAPQCPFSCEHGSVRTIAVEEGQKNKGHTTY